MSSPTVTNVTYDNTYPKVERAAGIVAETALALTPIPAKVAIVAGGALETLEARKFVEGVTRELTANKTTEYSDGTKCVVRRHGLGSTSTEYSPNGQITAQTTRAGSSATHIQYDGQGKPVSKTVYPLNGGVYTYDAKGRLVQSQCIIL